MSNSSYSARVFLSLCIVLMYLSACNLSRKNEDKKQTLKLSTFSHQLPSSSLAKNSYLFDYQKNKLNKSSTNNLKSSTDVIELALKDQSKPIMTFVQYSYWVFLFRSFLSFFLYSYKILARNSENPLFKISYFYTKIF